MRFSAALLVAAAWFALAPAASAETREDFLFRLRSALAARDYPAIARCIEFEGAHSETRAAVWKMIDQLVAWPTHFFKVTERKGSGPLIMKRDGKTHTLNGDWTFQIHIHIRKPPSRGFVLPAGKTSDGRYAILLAVPQKS